jgi:hypothetical protein
MNDALLRKYTGLTMVRSHSPWGGQEIPVYQYKVESVQDVDVTMLRVWFLPRGQEQWAAMTFTPNYLRYLEIVVAGEVVYDTRQDIPVDEQRWQEAAAEEEARRLEQARKQAEAEQERALRPECRQPVGVGDLASLMTLRTEVLKRNPKRCPKWAFRLAEDLVVQVQPRPTLAEWTRSRPQPLFLGVAVFNEGGVGPRVFDAAAKKDTPGRRVKFEIVPDGEALGLKLTGSWVGTSKDLLAFRDRLGRLIQDRLKRLKPDIMLCPQCLCCGKTLTDPASQARWIGPECAGQGGLDTAGLDRDVMTLLGVLDYVGEVQSRARARREE